MNYKNYSISELLQAVQSIDKDAYPDNYTNLQREVESRKQEIDAYKAQLHQGFEFTVENRIKVLGWLQVITGSVFFLQLIFGIFTGIDWLSIAVVFPIIFLNLISGIGLLRKLSFGLALSILNQSLQVISLKTGSFFYSYNGVASVFLGFESKLFFSFNLGIPSFNITWGENLGQFALSFDLLAAFFLGLLMTCVEFRARRSS